MCQTFSSRRCSNYPLCTGKTIEAAREVILNGCNHPPRVGGSCLPCDLAARAILPPDDPSLERS